MDLIPRRFMNDMFDDFMVTKASNPLKCDIYEKNGDYHIEMDVPGYKKEEIKIEAKKDGITISAEKNEETEEKDEEKNYIHKERHYGKFERSFYLQDLDTNSIEASFNDGVLKIKVPKLEEKENKKYIEIK